MNIPKMRTIQEVVNEFKLLDNDTKITVSGIRRLVKENKLKSVRVGNKVLLNFDSCINYFNNPNEDDVNEDKTQYITPVLIDDNRLTQFKKNIDLQKKS